MTEPANPDTVLGLDPRALLGVVMKKPAEDVVMRLGDYEILRRLAQGGMGTVYAARQASLQRTVALKMISSGLLATDAEVERFHREAEAAASLDHPGIVPIYEIGEAEGQHFFSMKLLEHGNLADLSAAQDEAARHSMAWQRRAAEITAQMARAVHHAHQRGVLHRDLKPTNVLMDEAGAPHLTDFGLAKLLNREAGLTRTVAVMGTPGYIAPEQAAGRAAEVTVAADIYSLGAVLYVLLSGRPPFDGESTLEVLRKVESEEPPPLRRANPALSRDLEIICLKCLQKSPARRFASAAELAVDLERWMAGEPIHSRAVGRMEKVRLWARRHPAAAVAVLLVTALAVVFTLAAVHLRRQRDESQENLLRSYLAQAHSQRLGTDPERRGKILNVLAAAAELRPSLEARNDAIAALALPALGPVETWFDEPLQPHTHQRIVSSDGERFLTFGQTEGVTLHDRRTRTVVRRLITPPQRLAVGKLSPDSRWFINFDEARDVHVYDLHRPGDEPLAPLFKLPGPCDYCADFMPDSRHLAVADTKGLVRLCDLESRTETKQFIVTPPPFRNLTLSPSGRQLAYFTGALAYVCSVESGAQTLVQKHQATVTWLAWHPSERQLATGCENGEVQLLDVVTGAVRRLTPHNQYAAGLAFTPDGALLASTGWDTMLRLHDVATGQAMSDTRESGGIQCVAGGRWLSTTNGTLAIRAREVRPSAVFRTLASATTGFPVLGGVDFSPDGRWIVSGNHKGLHVWNAATGEEAAHVASDKAWRPRFHPGGKFILTGSGQGVLLRWPVDGNGKPGAPEAVLEEAGESFLEVDSRPDGCTLAVPARRRSRLVRWDDFTRPVLLQHPGYHTGFEVMALSPDARWVAGATVSGHGVSVWNARDGVLLRHLIKSENARPAVSPDGTTLATLTAGELVLWDTDSWQPRQRRAAHDMGAVALPIAFSPDGTLLAAALNMQDIHLLHPRTAATLAVLTAPVPLNLETLRFSADSRRLAAQTLGPVLHVWDFVALRGELQRLGLDW